MQQNVTVTVAELALSAAEVAVLRASALATGGTHLVVQIVQHGPRGDSLPMARTIDL